MLRRSGGPVLGLVFACVLVGLYAPAPASAASEASGWLELDAGSSVYRLTPGESTHWPVDVHVRGEPATSLEVTLQAEPAAADLLGKFLSVELRACSRPWVHGQCPAGQTVLVQRTALSSAEGVRTDLMETGTSVSGGAHVLLTASLADEVPLEVQGSRTQILVGVHGSGDDAGNGFGDAGTGGPPGQLTGPPAGMLADTGARLGGAALLGLLAVAVGYGLARLRATAA